MDIQPYEMNHQPKKRRFFPSLFASVTGAVLGSIATLYLAPILGIHGITPSTQSVENKKTAVVEQSATSNSTLPLQPTSSSSNSMINAIENVTEAVVGVVNIQQQTNFYSNYSQDQEAGTGSGVIFKKSGNDAYIVTNNHVIEGANKVEVSLANGERVTADIVGTDPLTDLAVLKINGQHVKKVASFGDSSKLRIGEQVAAIGNPLGLDLSRTVTEGIVSGKRTISVSTSAGEWDLNVIQTDAAINPGNSGGALINSAGQVVGINSLKISEEGVEGLGFAIPSQDVKPIVEELLQYGKVKRPYLGVGLQDVSDFPSTIRLEQLNLPKDVTEGVVITAVEPSSPAAEAGLQAKDVIIAVDGTKIDSVSTLRKYLYTQTKVGEQVNIELLRDGKKINVSLKLSERGESQQ
ncbi:S1C family serine protease [Thermaerobacillus caldiproteolyticus]|uniref:S1C family serine protease n=1 Tax=Thermaerobacillus caldiproteolyticus TaxID=247480 RepID=UPI00188D0416|nr:trypsin-like peptidase domain-containing protein [Anoxybacillus caldiproteolyticus]QPA31284.1 trypsin-like peptidase domain-containing protein [Anoxybacillus caldiproteolyticus]